MKKILLSFIFLCVLLIIPVTQAYADTIVSGTINDDTTWTTEGSPYVLVGKVTVASGKTLTVQGGVEIRPLIPRFQSHQTHFDTEGKGPGITDCSVCHANPSPVDYAKCNTCHSPGGPFDGVNDPEVGAKNNFDDGVYEKDGKTLKPGKEKWCTTCHDSDPAIIQMQSAPDKAGDNLTFGYFVNGHGRTTNYLPMAWQDLLALGNPGANQACSNCHDTAKKHINPGTSNTRLKDGFENDQANTNCNNCHTPGGAATADPQFYTNYIDFENSAHKSKLCSECHDVHGSTGPYTAMTKGDKENLCTQCHGDHGGHALGKDFGKNGKNYKLQCTSCHNVHIITGLTSDTAPDKSALTKFTNNLDVWGDEPSEKIDNLAGSGKYVTPNGDTLSGTQLPDYPSFCLDCHGTSTSEFGIHGGINWYDGHGTGSADAPWSGWTVPDWFTSGMAEGWDGDDITDSSKAWPAIPRGRGEQIWTRGPYNQEERLAGANFVLSCNDCHSTHDNGSGKLRATVNGGSGSSIWNTMCNNCHYYYSNWHAGMACGVASCHAGNNSRFPGWNPVPNSIHSMEKDGGPGNARTFNRDLVAEMRFDNNLDDSGSFRMHGTWRVTSGSYSGGKSGNAIEINDDPVEIGTRNSYWSNDDGKHGTWRLTEMKYNMTLESWVYPTDNSTNERIIITKHNNVTGEDGGGYRLKLKKINGSYKAILQVNVNGGGTFGVQDPDANGWRGAYSSVGIPLNKWTHIGATFDTNGGSKRVRIYVDGVDVTANNTNVSSGLAQPLTDETSIFPYSQHSLPDDNTSGSPNYRNNPWGYDGHWTGTVLSIGGYNWSNTNENFVGKLDNVKIWNVTKDSSYFDSIDSTTPTRIDSVEGLYGSNEVRVNFSEGVYTDTGQSGALTPADFSFLDLDNTRTIQSVSHIPGSSTATLTLSSPLDESNDIFVDTLAAVSGQIFDKYNNPADTDAVTLTILSVSPPNQVNFDLNEPAGSSYVFDNAGVISGKVFGSNTLTGGEYSGSGDGSGKYTSFEYNNNALQADRVMTIETRIKPTGINSSNYIRRILGRTAGKNYQLSVWRSIGNSSFPNYTPPSGVASIAFWLYSVDSHGYSDYWKVALTNYTSYPIVSDHWYKVRVTWNSDKVGGIPADIYVDDEGTDGNGAGESWSGFANATNTSQSYQLDKKKLFEGDVINTSDERFIIGADAGNPANNIFNGLIDYVYWKNSVE